MPDPGFTRPDLCSIPAADAEAEPAGAARGGLSADGQPPPGDDLPAPSPRGIDCAIRLSTVAAVLAVAGIAAYVSYWHAYAVVRAHGETGITARLEPATIDGLVYASSMVVLHAARHRVPVPSLARWLLALGIAATLTANMAQGWSHGLVGAVVAAWPTVSLVGSYELLVWLIRTSGTPEREPSAGHRREDTACHAPESSVPAAVVDSGQHSQSDRDPGWRPEGQGTGQAATPASAQHDNGAPEAAADNDAAVAAYQLSVKAGNPLSERKLAQMFGRTSRRWARSRIADARQSLVGGHPNNVTAGLGRMIVRLQGGLLRTCRSRIELGHEFLYALWRDVVWDPTLPGGVVTSADEIWLHRCPENRPERVASTASKQLSVLVGRLHR